ncbi:DUF397 domain-containing protein [Nocardiopsis sp. CNR-923]|uniref:DUF397 domain-containing protein n=1 Tax=Nocardiopsis sp. CNR-923 TaxID=1904965 RepID=UPI000967F553|nr:DUF397 domain-containing protein [Nocardiopsis sp. CNR-923]OLT28184.1 DUF397 domain-containing protein [Nocardiopsis sp. CNR-923]
MLLEFHKSSYSTAQENCVEVAPILSFRKSSYSSGGENCVEVADLPTGAAIRDSKHPGLGFLPVGAAEWVSLTRLVRAEAPRA